MVIVVFHMLQGQSEPFFLQPAGNADDDPGVEQRLDDADDSGAQEQGQVSSTAAKIEHSIVHIRQQITGESAGAGRTDRPYPGLLPLQIHKI